MAFGRCIICENLIGLKAAKCPHCGMAIDDAFREEVERRRATAMSIRVFDEEAEEAKRKDNL